MTIALNPASEIIQRRKLYQEVANRLQEMILSGALPIGEQLPSERALMERFGVGRPAVREALLALQTAGLVAVSGGERARVVRPTPEGMVAGLDAAVRHWLSDPEGVRNVQGARRLFEAALAREAAGRRRDEDVARLRAALEANEAALADTGRFEQTDVAFHFALAEIPRNPIFTTLHLAVIGWLTQQRTISLRAPGAARHAAASHRRIFEAVAAGDPERAAHEMDLHLTDVADLYWRALDGEGA